MMTNLPSNTIFHGVPVGRKYFDYLLPPTNLTWSHRSQSELLKMHALLNWAIALSVVRTLFFDNSLIALHSFSFTQEIKDHSSLLSVRSIYKSDVPSSEYDRQNDRWNRVCCGVTCKIPCLYMRSCLLKIESTQLDTMLHHGMDLTMK